MASLSVRMEHLGSEDAANREHDPSGPAATKARIYVLGCIMNGNSLRYSVLTEDLR